MKAQACLISVLLFALGTTGALAQAPASKSDLGAYRIPFDTEGNRIELTLANETATVYEGVVVGVRAVPAWLRISDSIPADAGIAASTGHPELDSGSLSPDPTAMLNQVQHDIPPSDSRLFHFTFSVNDSAPTEEVVPLVLEVYAGDKLVATRQIDISVELPKEFVLRGNYPNPFNPSTTIGFVQPEDGDVMLDVFDALGRHVDRFEQYGSKRGQQTFIWNASSRATGVYFYRLQLRSDSGVKETRLGKMLLIK